MTIVSVQKYYLNVTFYQKTIKKMLKGINSTISFVHP